MVHRCLGNTGLLVSPVAFGAFKIGRNQKIKYAQAYELPDDAQVDRLLNGVLDLGINLIDTAPAYGCSEERIGRYLAGRRQQFILSSKVGETFENGQSSYDFSRAGITASVQRSLRRLKTEVLDLVFIHSDGRDLEILEHTDAVATLQDLVRQGLIRFIGLSGKSVEGARRSLAWANVLMVEYHPADESHGPVIAEAHAAGLGVLVKKPLAAGALAPARAIPFILRTLGVASLVVGGLNLAHLHENLDLATRSIR